jgi:hypothetical protein
MTVVLVGLALLLDVIDVLEVLLTLRTDLAVLLDVLDVLVFPLSPLCTKCAEQGTHPEELSSKRESASTTFFDKHLGVGRVQSLRIPWQEPSSIQFDHRVGLL